MGNLPILSVKCERVKCERVAWERVACGARAKCESREVHLRCPKLAALRCAALRRAALRRAALRRAALRRAALRRAALRRAALRRAALRRAAPLCSSRFDIWRRPKVVKFKRVILPADFGTSADESRLELKSLVLRWKRRHLSYLHNIFFHANINNQIRIISMSGVTILVMISPLVLVAMIMHDPNLKRQLFYGGPSATPDNDETRLRKLSEVEFVAGYGALVSINAIAVCSILRRCQPCRCEPVVACAAYYFFSLIGVYVVLLCSEDAKPYGMGSLAVSICVAIGLVLSSSQYDLFTGLLAIPSVVWPAVLLLQFNASRHVSETGEMTPAIQPSNQPCYKCQVDF
jgi:hypothetical protein